MLSLLHLCASVRSAVVCFLFIFLVSVSVHSSLCFPNVCTCCVFWTLLLLRLCCKPIPCFYTATSEACFQRSTLPGFDPISISSWSAAHPPSFLIGKPQIIINYNPEMVLKINLPSGDFSIHRKILQMYIFLHRFHISLHTAPATALRFKMHHLTNQRIKDLTACW